MKKKPYLIIFSIMCFAFCVIASSRKANGSCSISKGDKIVFSCVGEVGTCDGKKFGYTLVCSGKLSGENAQAPGVD